MAEKFKTLFQNDKLKIVERSSRRDDIPHCKWAKSYYADFGSINHGEYGMLPSTIDFYSKKELKDFLKINGIEKEFSNRFLKTV